METHKLMVCDIQREMNDVNKNHLNRKDLDLINVKQFIYSILVSDPMCMWLNWSCIGGSTMPH